MADLTPNPNDTSSDDDQTLGNQPSLRYNLDSLDEYLATGEKVAREGRLAEAVDLMREATNRFPESATGKYNLGVALFLRLREDKAHLELWEDLADDEQLADEAIVALEGAIDSDPSFVAAYNNLARLYALRNRSEEALAMWGRSLELDPNQETVRAEMELYRGKLAPTEEDLEEKKLVGKDDEPQV